MFQLKYLDNTNEEEKGSLFVNENCTVILVYNGEIHVNDCLSSILKKNSKKKKKIEQAGEAASFLPEFALTIFTVTSAFIIFYLRYNAHGLP